MSGWRVLIHCLLMTWMLVSLSRLLSSLFYFVCFTWALTSSKSCYLKPQISWSSCYIKLDTGSCGLASVCCILDCNSYWRLWRQKSWDHFLFFCFFFFCKYSTLTNFWHAAFVTLWRQCVRVVGALYLQSGGPRLKPSTLTLNGFVLHSCEFNSLAALCK